MVYVNGDVCDLYQLSNLTNLTDLKIGEIGVHPHYGLDSAISMLTNLRRLSVFDDVQYEDVSPLLSLEELTVEYDISAEAIGSLPSLRKLEPFGRYFGTTTLNDFTGKLLPPYRGKVNDSHLLMMPNLKSLDCCADITYESIRQLTRFERLTIEEPDIMTPEQLASLTRLRKLYLSRANALLVALNSLTNLTSLKLVYVSAQNEHISALTNLTTLKVTETKITDSVRKHLLLLPKIRWGNY
jgi:hypothetical protein